MVGMPFNGVLADNRYCCCGTELLWADNADRSAAHCNGGVARVRPSHKEGCSCSMNRAPERGVPPLSVAKTDRAQTPAQQTTFDAQVLSVIEADKSVAAFKMAFSPPEATAGIYIFVSSLLF